VIPAASVVSKVTAPPNSVGAALNVIVWPEPDRKSIEAAKLQDPEVVRFVHEPLTVQAPPVFVM
jgi:hypothetical protein